MKKLLLALALLLLPSAAWAQCNGVFPNNTVCGNVTGANNTPRPTSPSAFLGAAGGTNGQVQYNNNGALGGLTNIQLFGLTSGITNASQYGIKCDGTTDDGPAFTTAFAALAGAPLILPVGTCRIATTAYLNTTSAPGILTVPGMKIIGQGRGVTKIDTAVANGYALAANPAWAALHHSMFALTPGTSGAFAANTYFVETTVTDNLSNEIVVSPARSVVTTGASGSIALTLQPITAGYSYNIYIGTTSTPANYATVSGANAVGLPAGAVTITAIGGAHAIPTGKQAVWQEALLANLSITNSTAAANASGALWFRVGYSQWLNVYSQGLTGDGLDIPNWTGDSDGSFVVTVDQSKFDNIAGWCINTAGNTLEFSNFTISNTTFNLCGTLPSNFETNVVISAITNANPGVATTATPHGLQLNDQIYISGVAGMTLGPSMFRACGTVSGSTFSICDLNKNNINTTSLGTYTANSGAEDLAWRPPTITNGAVTGSGAIAWTGLIGNFINNDFTQVKNTALYFSEAGANDSATISGNDWENTYGKGLYAAAINNLTWNNSECLSATALGPTLSCAQLGTGLGTGGAINVQINNIKVRSDVGNANGFEQLFGAGGTINQNTVTITNILYSSWAGLNKYVGFLGNPRPAFWARLDGKTGSVCTIKDSFNIASCVRNSTGNYTITFTTPQLDALYTFSGNAQNTGVAVALVTIPSTGNLTTTTVTFVCDNLSSAAQDCDYISVEGFGNPF